MIHTVLLGTLEGEAGETLSRWGQPGRCYHQHFSTRAGRLGEVPALTPFCIVVPFFPSPRLGLLLGCIHCPVSSDVQSCDLTYYCLDLNFACVFQSHAHR